MKRILSFLVFVFMFVFTLAGCGQTNPTEEVTPSTTPTQVVEKHTVQFYVEDDLYKTLKIADGTTIGASSVADPLKDGFTFVSWVNEGSETINLDTYVVTSALKLYATFEEVITDDTLIVNGVKEEGVDYYLVVGWWETTALADDGSPKITSSLTVDYSSFLCQ